jgi:hypothetical protein
VTSGSLARSDSTPLVKVTAPRLCLLGALLIFCGFAFYLAGVLFAAPRVALGLGPTFRAINEAVVWYSGVPVFFGISLVLLDLFVFAPHNREGRRVAFEVPANRRLTVVLTAFNDDASIADAVKDFASHPLIQRVIVVDNNSRDRTTAVALGAGADVVLERQPGYGHCVYRALTEGARQSDTELTLLCEGDMTFRAFDIDKFMAYIAHVDIVNGTRIVEQLRDEKTQLTTFMYYGNFAVGKLLEIKHLGKGTFTDVGTTYKLCRNTALARLLPRLDPRINLEFNAHFLDVALGCGLNVVECPVTFFPRVGVSKGGNVSDVRALKVGGRMILGLLFGWGLLRQRIAHPAELAEPDTCVNQ